MPHELYGSILCFLFLHSEESTSLYYFRSLEECPVKVQRCFVGYNLYFWVTFWPGCNTSYLNKSIIFWFSFLKKSDDSMSFRRMYFVVLLNSVPRVLSSKADLSADCFLINAYIVWFIKCQEGGEKCSLLKSWNVFYGPVDQKPYLFKDRKRMQLASGS